MSVSRVLRVFMGRLPRYKVFDLTCPLLLQLQQEQIPQGSANRRESSGGMEWLGVWNCFFSGSEISKFRSLKFGKNRSFCGI